MSSPRKQQKKHKRASAKARQNRILRNTAEAPKENNPDALSPEYISMEEFFEGGMDMGAFDDLFDAMAAAELEGQQAVAHVFLSESPLPLVLENYSEDDVSDLIISLWIAYYEKHHNLSEEDAMARIESPAFSEAYTAAAAAIADGPDV